MVISRDLLILGDPAAVAPALLEALRVGKISQLEAQRKSRVILLVHRHMRLLVSRSPATSTSTIRRMFCAPCR